MLKDKFFWESYGKFSAVFAAGSALATFGLDVPTDVSVRLLAGGLAAFPVAFAMGAKSRQDKDQVEVPAGPQ
jgi:hypothetical protein